MQPTITPAPTETPVISESPDDEWESLAPGLERRTLQPDTESISSQIVVVRVDPSQYRFRAHYRPGEPLRASEWAELLPDAAVIVNANFFDPENRILGLLISDGVVYGSSYIDRGGTFLVQDGVARVRSNLREPYQGEPLEQAVQAFPMLVLDGLAAFQSERQEFPSRRTVVAQDDQGRILLMATPFFGLTLENLSSYLAGAGLGIQTALNLDGGGSTLMVLGTGAEREVIVASFDPVPAVLAVYSGVGD
ncbi:MAG: phosphodiester glycosidase family protein [Anaerolineae bacterium]|nr:phosphodiester glycosidase family protein [Anaerolineae bacterium]